MSVYLTLFVAAGEICFLLAIILVHFIPYDFRKNKMEPFFEKHKIIGSFYVIMCAIGFLYFMYHLMTQWQH